MRMRALDAIYRVAPVRRGAHADGAGRAGLKTARVRGSAGPDRPHASPRRFPGRNVPSAMAKFIIRSAVSDVTNPARRSGTAAPGGHVPGNRASPLSVWDQARARPAGSFRIGLRLLHERRQGPSATGQNPERPRSRRAARTPSCSARSSRSAAKRGMMRSPWPRRPGSNWAKTFRGRRIRRKRTCCQKLQHARQKKAEDGAIGNARRPEAPCARCRLRRRGRTSPAPLRRSSPVHRARPACGPGRDRHKRRSGSRARGAVTAGRRRGRPARPDGASGSPRGKAIDAGSGSVWLAHHERPGSSEEVWPAYGAIGHPMGPGRLSSDKTTFASTPPTPGKVMIRRLSTRSKIRQIAGRPRAAGNR